MATKVKFKGVEYWLGDARPDGHGQSLGPLDHYCDDGTLDMLTCFNSDSYAHLFPDGRLLRYGRQIGTKDDLIPVHEEETTDDRY